MFGGAGTDDLPEAQPAPWRAVQLEGKEIPALPMEGNPPSLKTSDACMGCHDQRDNPHGVPLCQTGNEYIDSGSNVNCLSCHMPMANGIADHSMGGGHNQAVLSRAALFDVKTEQGRRQVDGQGTHHEPAAPLAAHRCALPQHVREADRLRRQWRGGLGERQGPPVESDPQAFFVFTLTDDKGMPAPPPTATQAGEDTRLKPHEERTLTYEIPAEGVVLVRGELYYNLLWPGLAKKFSHLPEELRTPV